MKPVFKARKTTGALFLFPVKVEPATKKRGVTMNLDTLVIKDAYRLGYDEQTIKEGLEKLPPLFSLIGKVQGPADTDRRLIALLFYIGIFSEYTHNALRADCEALAKRYRMKSPSPGMREIRLLPKIGFTIDCLDFIEGVAEKKGRIDEMARFVVSHPDTSLLLALKVFATACTLSGRDTFSRLDFMLLSADAPIPYRPSAAEKSPLPTLDSCLCKEEFSMLSSQNKAFILAFDREMETLGYDFGGHIGSGYVWGPYMIIYAKTGVKTKQVAARIYIRENGIVLRLFLSKIDHHRAYIENAPHHIKAAFLKGHGDCSCNPKKENCNFRKTYTIEGSLIEKCSGVVFEFHDPDMAKLPDYVGLLQEFYGKKKAK